MDNKILRSQNLKKLGALFMNDGICKIIYYNSHFFLAGTTEKTMGPFNVRKEMFSSDLSKVQVLEDI